jgi:hypothetical protein
VCWSTTIERSDKYQNFTVDDINFMCRLDTRMARERIPSVVARVEKLGLFTAPGPLPTSGTRVIDWDAAITVAEVHKSAQKAGGHPDSLFQGEADVTYFTMGPIQIVNEPESSPTYEGCDQCTAGLDGKDPTVCRGKNKHKVKKVKNHWRVEIGAADAVLKSPNDPTIKILVLGEPMERAFFAGNYTADRFQTMAPRQKQALFQSIMKDADGKKKLYLLNCKATLEADRGNFVKVQVLNAKKYVEEGDDEEDN